MFTYLDCFLFYNRPFSAERKLSNDKIHIKKRVEKLHEKIIDREADTNFARRRHNNSAINGRQFDISPQKKRKSSINPRTSPTSGEDLRTELAITGPSVGPSSECTSSSR